MIQGFFVHNSKGQFRDQAQIFVNLNRKKVLSFTPRSCILKFLILALKDSAAALELL